MLILYTPIPSSSLPLAVGILHDNMDVCSRETVLWQGLMYRVPLIYNNQRLPSNRPVIIASIGARL